MEQEEYLGRKLDFDEPALKTADSSIDDPLEAAIDAVTKERGPSIERKGRVDDVTISKDITGQSTGTGEYSDFEAYFKSRYNKLYDILKKRRFEASPISVSALGRRRNRRGENDVTVIGLVESKWQSRNGNQMLKIEDPTGLIRVVFTDEEVQERCVNIIENEVVAVTGQLSDDGNIIFGDDFFYPEVPASHKKNTADTDAQVVLLSDIHFGSKDFNARKWNSFVDWLRQQERVEHVLVAGDIVEGIGVYPGQKDELVVESITEQYEIAAEAFKEFPDDVEIILSVGNHDSIRLSEPQPALPDKFTGKYPENVRFVGNPVMVSIEGVKFLLYHGMSLNPIIEFLPEMDIQKPELAMRPLLEKRHLVPMWGGGVRIAPEKEDHLVIDEIPDFFHTGHVHTYGQDRYNGVTMVNTGCWQERTDFQVSKNVFPDVGHAVVVELKTGEMKKFSF